VLAQEGAAKRSKFWVSETFFELKKNLLL